MSDARLSKKRILQAVSAVKGEAHITRRDTYEPPTIDIEIYVDGWWIGSYLAGHIQCFYPNRQMAAIEHFRAAARFMSALVQMYEGPTRETISGRTAR